MMREAAMSNFPYSSYSGKCSTRVTSKLFAKIENFSGFQLARKSITLLFTNKVRHGSTARRAHKAHSWRQSNGKRLKLTNFSPTFFFHQQKKAQKSTKPWWTLCLRCMIQERECSFQLIDKIFDVNNGNSGPWYLFKNIEMSVIRDNVFGIGGNSAIHEFVVIDIFLDEGKMNIHFLICGCA